MEDLIASRPASHKPTLTTLISSIDLEKLPLKSNDYNGEEAGSGEGEGLDYDLPSNEPLNSKLFETKPGADEWDASDFLLTRKHVALDELRSELRSYLTTLRSSLIEVINTEYESFIGLSLGLRQASVSSSLQIIKQPVLSIRHQVDQVSTSLVKMKEEMTEVLDERKRVREEKSLLGRLLECEEIVGKVENRLQVGISTKGESKEANSSSEVDSPAKRLQTIAGEYNHMLYLVSKAGGDLPFVQALQPRIARITSTLQLDLSQLLTSVLTTLSSFASDAVSFKATRAELSSLLKTYASLDLIPVAEEIIRQTLVRPVVTKLIHRDVLNSVQSPVLSASVNLPPVDSKSNSLAPAIELDESIVPSAYVIEPISSSSLAEPPSNSLSTDIDPLMTLYNRILASVSRDFGLVLDVSNRCVSSTNSTTNEDDQIQKRTHYDLLTNVIWEEISTRLISELGSIIFAAGRPTIFHQNYLLTMSFIAKIESISSSLSNLFNLRNSSSYNVFIKRFQLPVYYQLRFKEIVTSVERALDVGSASGGGDLFVMSESDAVWRALRMCWSDEVWLDELNPRFWKLTLQLISRYRTWINGVVPRYVMPTSANASLSVGGSATPIPRSSFDAGDRDRIRPTVSASGTPRPGTPQSDEATEEATLRQLTVLIADATLMERKVLELFEDRIAPRLPSPNGADDEAGESPSAIIRESLSQTTSLVPSLSSQIVTILVKRCAEPLKLVRSTVSQVRASTRRGPLEPSYFVNNILKDLRGYVGGVGRVVEEEERKRWSTAVVEEIAHRYATVLSAQKKTDESLRWYKKGRSAGLSLFGRGNTPNPNEEATPDDDRVKQQMQIDIDTLAKDASGLGVDTEHSEAFRALRMAIEEEKK